MLSLLGLPKDDEELLASCRRFVAARIAYMEGTHSRPEELPEISERALARGLEFREKVRVIVERGPVSGSDDLITAFWNDGPSIFPDWGVEDVITGVMTAVSGGSHTTSVAASNGLHLMVDRLGVQDMLRAGGPQAVDVFVEESLRIHGVGHLSRRMAARDCEIGGVPVAEGTTVYLLVAAANLDPAHYPRPREVDLDRSTPRDHLSFLLGPRACGGMWLARGELAVIYGTVLERLRDLRLDPDEAPPELRGFLTRHYKPLHVLFAATGS
jgi:cytochrome P450